MGCGSWAWGQRLSPAVSLLRAWFYFPAWSLGQGGAGAYEDFEVGVFPESSSGPGRHQGGREEEVKAGKQEGGGGGGRGRESGEQLARRGRQASAAGRRGRPEMGPHSRV